MTPNNVFQLQRSMRPGPRLLLTLWWLLVTLALLPVAVLLRCAAAVLPRLGEACRKLFDGLCRCKDRLAPYPVMPIRAGSVCANRQTDKARNKGD